MNEIDKFLHRTNTPIREAAKLLQVSIDEINKTSLIPCSSCSTWLKPKELKPDLDNLLICNLCSSWYGD